MSTFDDFRSLSSSSCRTSLPVRFAVVCRRSLTLCQARDHGKSGSLIRSTALLPRSKLGTRHTPDDMYSPTRQPAKRCREPAAFAAADRGDRARRVRGDRHGEATVIPYDAAGASARACGSVEGSTLGAAEVRRLHHQHHPRLGAVPFLRSLLYTSDACRPTGYCTTPLPPYHQNN